VNRSETAYARSGDVHLGYQVVGDGPFDIVLIDQWFSNVDALWRLPPLARFVERLAAFGRVILLNNRGTGISDPVPLGGLPTLEEWMDDIRAVMDAAGSSRAALISGAGASYLTLLFAASYPGRTASLVLVDGYARLQAAGDYLHDAPRLWTDTEVEDLRSTWGTAALLRRLAPSEYRDPELRRAFAEYERQSSSPAIAGATLKMLFESDLRHVLPAIRVPTLVVAHRDSARIPKAASEYMAAHIEGARYVELPGSENLIWAGDQAEMALLIQEFVTGVRAAPEMERVLATVLFTDIVGSTDRAAAVGDHAWRELLERHYRTARQQLAAFRGQEVTTTGDGIVATFDGPARAIRCAQAMVEAMRAMGLEVRTGLHTGEIERAGPDIRGLGVHIGARVMSLAGPGEVLVSSTVKDLVVGSGIEFEDRGVHALKGVPGEWRLYAVSG
jgi:class 3 adenylate cyclase